MTDGRQIIENWFRSRSWKPFNFQRQVWDAAASGKQGLLNAPTGSGKTHALWFPSIIDWINRHPETFQNKEKSGLRLIWITPLRALAKDIQQAMQQSVNDLGIPWEIGRRTGDVSQSMKQKQKRQMPEVLITTPESLHVLMAQKNYPRYFRKLERVVVDEWHELLSSKRGIQTELALSRLRALRPGLQTWGVSATIGNLDEALGVLLGPNTDPKNRVIIKAGIDKEIEVHSILPDDVEKFPWYGHLGLKLAHKILPVIDNSSSTLIFTNTRGQSELWFQKLLEIRPDLAGSIALHHGSLDRKVRNWVEDSLHEGSLKAVVCTSSLDLGVDFSPVETVIQVGSPKGVARFMQRAGRSGHSPGTKSIIYFVPTHALELIEAAALKSAIKNEEIESRPPILKPFDVLVQYLVTLAVSDGFDEKQLFEQVKNTFAYQTLNRQEWEKLLQFLTTGGRSLGRYDEYSKLVVEEEIYKVTDRRIARRHRMSIGTIASDSSMRVKYMTGGSLGSIEEWFIGQLKPGDKFWFSGKMLELVKTKDMTAFVKRASGTKAKTPSWLGGRMSLSSNMSAILRRKMQQAVNNESEDVELKTLEPLLDVQKNWSILPGEDEFLMEKTFSREGCHVFFFPFEGRYVHEGMAALFAHRIAQIKPLTFSIAMNDYGFELLSDQEIPIENALENNLFSSESLIDDIWSSINNTELAKRRFRQICQVAGLVFPGFPGQQRKSRHLQMSSGVFFDVFSEYEPDHLLLQQAYDEVLFFQLDELRLQKALQKIRRQQIRLEHPERFTPYAFPIMVDRLRERLSSEKLTDRVKRMQLQLEKHT